MLKILLAILLPLSAFSASPDFEVLKVQFIGCYVGTDKFGSEVSAALRFVKSNSEGISLSVDNQSVDYLELSFFSQNARTALVTQMFEKGALIDSRELNNQITYKFTGELVRTLNGEILGKMRNENIISITHKIQNYTIEVYQNDNTILLPDVFAGYTRTNFQRYNLKKSNCLQN